LGVLVVEPAGTKDQENAGASLQPQKASVPFASSAFQDFAFGFVFCLRGLNGEALIYPVK
jgi:hypothetical protein